jgi:quinoprotein dehydrogenase-associated probable ABC transporter substrate-binding protein
MSSASKLPSFLLLSACTLAACALPCAAAPTLRVCSDPNNLPYSNREQQGFENGIAQLLAKDMGLQVTYFWFPQREKFFKKTLNSGVCDVVMGVPKDFDEADTTRPYYRSTYVFVSRRDRNLHISSFDDPRLRTLRIGVHILGEQDDSLPPVHALTSRGIVQNLVGYSIFGNLAEKNPSADLIAAVTKKDVDVAVVWGPLAGYFTQHSAIPLDITPIESDPANPALPLTFDIGLGVREGDSALKNQLDAELLRRHTEIEAILRSYGIPQLNLAASSVAEEK